MNKDKYIQRVSNLVFKLQPKCLDENKIACVYAIDKFLISYRCLDITEVTYSPENELREKINIDVFSDIDSIMFGEELDIEKLYTRKVKNAYKRLINKINKNI